MQCPVCKSISSRVLDTRDTAKEVRRRRACSACGFRFTTSEAVRPQKARRR